MIRRRGKESVPLVAASDLSSWIETAYLLRSQRNAQRLMEAGERADRKEGRPVDVEDLGRQLGLTDG